MAVVGDGFYWAHMREALAPVAERILPLGRDASRLEPIAAQLRERGAVWASPPTSAATCPPPMW